MADIGKLKRSWDSYNKIYRDDAFYAWYQNGRPSFQKLVEYLPANQDGFIPDPTILKKWSDNEGWVEKANKLDEEVHAIINMQIISDRVELLKRHKEVGKTLITMGMEFLEKTPLQSANTALRMVELGLLTEKESSELEKILDRIRNMDSPQINSRLEALLGKTKLVKSGDLEDDNIDDE